MKLLKLLLKNITEICLILLIVAIIVMNLFSIEVTEPLKTVVMLVVGAFFWAKTPWLINDNNND